MKKILSILCFSAITIFCGCKKDVRSFDQFQNNNSFVDSSLSFLKNNLSSNDYDSLNLQDYKFLRYQNKNIGLQIFQKTTANKFLMLIDKGGIFSGNWVDLSQLKNIHPEYKSGSIFLQSLNRKSTTTLIVDSNSVLQIINPNANETGISYKLNSKNHADTRTDNTTVSIPYEVLPEVVVYGVGGNSGNSYDSFFWLTNGDYDYFGSYYPGGVAGGSSPGTYYGGTAGVGSSGQGSPVGGSGSGQSNNVVVAPTFFPPEDPILDLAKELKCFTISSSSTYNISVNVNEPFPNSRDVFNPRANFLVGHTFLTLEQHNSDGSSIIRTIGFYPKHSVKPGNTYDEGIFGDDSYTPFDVSLKFDVSGTDMTKVINTLLDQQDMAYDMNTFNCTNSPMAALSTINIDLPSTKATEVIFSGNSPADLGEDIRTLDINTFSAANGHRKIIRTVSNTNNLMPPPKKGTC